MFAEDHDASISETVVFFPAARDGLFPVTRTDEGLYLLIDPKNDNQVYSTDNLLCSFRKHAYNLLDLLYLSFTGKKDFDYWGTPENSHVSHVRFFKKQKDAFQRA